MKIASFENRKIGNLQSAPNDSKLKKSGVKSSLHMCTVVPRVSKFSSVLFYNQPFSKILHILRFPIDSHVNISKCHIFKNFWQMPKTFITLYFPYCMPACLIYTKVWLRSDQNCRSSSILKFPAPYSPVLITRGPGALTLCLVTC